jgi:branched-chain amino acid transport system ATP-binding protein
MDQLTLGVFSPSVLLDVARTTGRLAAADLTVRDKAALMVEQNVRFGLPMASSGIVMESGRVLLTGPAQSVLANPENADRYFGGAVHAPVPSDSPATQPSA